MAIEAPRSANNSRRALHSDLESLGLRARRGHDLRRTFIRLARGDGGRADVLRPRGAIEPPHRSPPKPAVIDDPS